MTVLTVDDLVIREQVEPGRRVPDGAPAPYQPGDLCEVLFHPVSSTEGGWLTAVVVACARPSGLRRFQVTVAIGDGINGFFKNDRIYCWEDGTGEEIRPLPFTPYPD